MEFIYYERKLYLLHYMIGFDNSVVRCIMSMFVQCNEYIVQLCKRCNLSTQHSISFIHFIK